VEAWEVLGDPERRREYDQSSGYVSELKSVSLTLTPLNYEYLVGESQALWVIQVLDSTVQYSRYFARFWEDLALGYEGVGAVKFGRVDIWRQRDMGRYLPYNFQVFPAVYVFDRSYAEICSFDYERPTEGLRRCLETAIAKTDQLWVGSVKDYDGDGKDG
jgi:curved DNA-binding protein CbpA